MPRIDAKNLRIKLASSFANQTQPRSLSGIFCRALSPFFTRLQPSFSFNPQFQSLKLLLGHALQSHRCGQIQSGNVFHFVAACYLATEFLYFWVSAHFQKHFIGIGDGQSLFNQAMLNQNAMIRRYRQRRWMGLRSALVLFWVFHCTMLTRFLNAVISLVLVRSKIVYSGLNALRFCATLRSRTNHYLRRDISIPWFPVLP